MGGQVKRLFGGGVGSMCLLAGFTLFYSLDFFPWVLQAALGLGPAAQLVLRSHRTGHKS